MKVEGGGGGGRRGRNRMIEEYVRVERNGWNECDRRKDIKGT